MRDYLHKIYMRKKHCTNLNRPRALSRRMLWCSAWLVLMCPSWAALAQNPPLLFQALYSFDSENSDRSSATDPGFNPVPGLWHFDPMSNGIPSLRTASTYAWQARRASGNVPTAWRAFYVIQDAAAVVGGNPVDAHDIANTLAWFASQHYALDYVFDDFEGQGTTGDWSNIANLIDQVRSSAAGATANIGSYGRFSGALELSQNYPYESDHRVESEYYAATASNGAAGLTVAMPSCYPLQTSTFHSDDSYNWGEGWWTQRTGLSTSDQAALAQLMTYNQQAATTTAYMSPNERAAMFYAPLEEFSEAKRNLPAGQQIIPWVSAYQPWPSSPALQPGQVPTTQDNEALLEHFRLRGADGFYAFGSDEDPGVTGTYADGTTFYVESYHAYSADMTATWHSMDWFFALPTQVGTVTANGPLNLDTFKNTGGTYADPGGMNGGIEWSAYQRGNRILAVISNLGNGDQAATGNGTGNNGNWQSVFAALGAGLPAESPIVPKGNHLIVQYLSNSAEPNFSAFAQNTVLGTTQGWHTSAADFVVTAPAGSGDASNAVVSILNGSAVAWFANGSTANPGGIGTTSSDMMMYSFKIFTGWSGSGSASFAPVVGSGSTVPIPSQQNGPTLWVYTGGTNKYWAFGSNYASGGPFHSTNFAPVPNTWYAVEMIVDPSMNMATIYAANLTTGGGAWTLLQFDDTRTMPVENLTSIPAGLVPGEDSPNLYDGYQIQGSAGAQFDGISAQLYPYPGLPMSSYSPSPPAPPNPTEEGSSDNGSDGPLPTWALGILAVGLIGIASGRLKKPAYQLRHFRDR